jgi:rsbT antagonist protein RsbS
VSLPGVHLTRIGATDFLLEPLRSLNISDSAKLVEGIVERLLQAGAARLYYDLSTQTIIDPVYYEWLNRLARTVGAINVKMVCVHMQPTAAYSLVQFERETPVFGTALDISVWKDGARGK